jgi:hypothetical protein
LAIPLIVLLPIILDYLALKSFEFEVECT